MRSVLPYSDSLAPIPGQSMRMNTQKLSKFHGNALRVMSCQITCLMEKLWNSCLLAFRNEQLELPAEMQEQLSRKESTSEKGKCPSKWNLKSA